MLYRDKFSISALKYTFVFTEYLNECKGQNIFNSLKTNKIFIVYFLVNLNTPFSIYLPN